MSIGYLPIKTDSVLWRNMELPHPNTIRKSPHFGLDGVAFNFECSCIVKDRGGVSRYQEEWNFSFKAPNDSFDYIIVPYVEKEKKYIRIAPTIKHSLTRSVFEGSIKPESDQINMLFIFMKSSRELNVIESPLPILKDSGRATTQSLKTISTQTTIGENNEVCKYSCKYCGTESIETLCLKGLSEDIEKLFNNAESADATVKCADKSFSVHRKILATRSEVFSAMFKHDLSEKNSGIVDIVDLDPDILEQFLRYLYSGQIEEMFMDLALKLYQVADKYSVITLKQLCASYILNNISKDILYEVLILADKAGDVEFMDGITSFAMKIKDLLKSTEWEEFAEKFPNIAVKVYFKHFKRKT